MEKVINILIVTSVFVLSYHLVRLLKGVTEGFEAPAPRNLLTLGPAPAGALSLFPQGSRKEFTKEENKIISERGIINTIKSYYKNLYSQEIPFEIAVLFKGALEKEMTEFNTNVK